MPRTVAHLPYGFEPEKETIRGTLIVYDAFDIDYSIHDLQTICNWAEEHDLARVVLYPLHEQTIRRMVSKSESAAIEPYHVRLKRLEELTEHIKHISIDIDEWERKRKKYTPIDSALQFLTDKYKGPHFVGLSGHTANLFAAYSSFEPWIRKLRLLIYWIDNIQPHPNLIKFESRWEAMPPSLNQ